MFHKHSNRFSLLVVVMMVLSHIIFFRYFSALNFASVWIGTVSIPKVFDERESRDKHRQSRCVCYLRWPYIMGLFTMYERRLISTLLTYIHPSDICAFLEQVFWDAYTHWSQTIQMNTWRRCRYYSTWKNTVAFIVPTKSQSSILSSVSSQCFHFLFFILLWSLVF